MKTCHNRLIFFTLFGKQGTYGCHYYLFIFYPTIKPDDNDDIDTSS